MKEKLAPLTGKISNHLFSCDVIVVIQQSEHIEDCAILLSFYNFKSDDKTLLDMFMREFNDIEFIFSSEWLEENDLTDEFKKSLMDYSLSDTFSFQTTHESNSEYIHYDANKKEFRAGISIPNDEIEDSCVFRLSDKKDTIIKNMLDTFKQHL